MIHKALYRKLKIEQGERMKNEDQFRCSGGVCISRTPTGPWSFVTHIFRIDQKKSRWRQYNCRSNNFNLAMQTCNAVALVTNPVISH